MKGKHSILTEHYLVPAVLFLLNIALAQSIHAFASDMPTYTVATKAVLIVALAFFVASLVFKKKILLTGSILFYIVAILWF